MDTAAELTSALSLLRRDDGLPYSWGRGVVRGERWWLSLDGEVVAYCHTVLDPREEEARLVLQELEVREGFQGRGLARTLVTAVEEATGERLWTDGGFTPEGFRALTFLPVAPGFEREECFRSQSFVEDWEALRSK